MLINQDIAILTSRILLVPYEEHHVPTYHSWMKDEEIREATASEPLSLPDEYSMQHSWRTDPDKLTFIACLPLDNPASGQKTANVVAHRDDASDRMIGDINLFLTPADEDPQGCIGEVEIMIAPEKARRQGYGRAALLAFLKYLQKHLDGILDEYGAGQNLVLEKMDTDEETSSSKMRLLQLRARIGSKNEKSINLFRSIGFVKIGQGENYFGEIEMVFEGFLGEERMNILCEKWTVTGYEELKYDRLEDK